ncbi:MAG: extracellular metalloproteinase [Acidobacteriota bacterium]
MSRRAVRPSWPRVACTLATVFALAALAANAVEDPRNFDARIAYNADFQVEASTDQAQALQGLRAPGIDLSLSFDPTTGVTRTVNNRIGYLTQAQDGDPETLAVSFLGTHREGLGLAPSDLQDLELTDRVFSKVTGATHLYYRQTHAGLPVYNGQLHVNVNRQGRILSVNNALLPNLATVAGSTAPSLSAADAVTAGAAQAGLTASSAPQVLQVSTDARRLTTLRAAEISAADIQAELMWLPIRRGEVRLVWRYQLKTHDSFHHWDFTVDAHSGDVWTRLDWVADASYRVFEQPVESPIHSPAPPPADGRTLVVDPQDLSRSPLGWHDDGTTTYTIPRGNNVHAFDDLDGNNQPPAVEPDCGAGLVCDFDFPIDFGSADPVDYTSAAVANLFYWVNITHDIQYGYGFDEEAGNFQNDNFGNGGLGSDPVQALSQKSGFPCPNNAFFGTPPDGQEGEMIMCLWTNSNPRRDFSWDSGVMVHEIGHGISNRLVGGPSNVGCLGNAQQGGEGYSDWWALAYTGEVGDQGTDVRGSGTYILGQPTTGPGVRPLPYSTDPAVNNHTYESISGVSVPHGVGAVWAQAAWEVYWALVDEYGFDPDLYDALGGSGNQRAMLYVNEGFKNTACSPTFTEVRDGMLQAAVDNFGGVDVCLMWEAFAAFGLGTDAISGGPSSLSPTNGFAIPDSCNNQIFVDGFESGNVTSWTTVSP